MKAIKSHIRSENYEYIIKLAAEIRDWAVKMPQYFPEGSNEKPSVASPAIWLDFSDFKNAAMKNETTAKQLIAAAKAEDQTAVVDGFKAVAASSKSFHQSYKLHKSRVQAFGQTSCIVGSLAILTMMGHLSCQIRVCSPANATPQAGCLTASIKINAI